MDKKRKLVARLVGIVLIVAFLVTGLAGLTAYAASDEYNSTENVVVGTVDYTYDKNVYTLRYQLKDKGTDATAVITSIKVDSSHDASTEGANKTLKIPATAKVSISKERLQAIGGKQTKATDITFKIVGIGDVKELNWWGRFTQFFKNLFNIEDSIFTGQYRPSKIVFNGTGDGGTSSNYIEAIGTNAFYNCSEITELTLTYTKNLVEIGEYAFAGTSLGSLTIPAAKNLTEIPDNMCDDCGSLTAVTISAPNVARIGKNAFGGNELLKTFTLNTEIKDTAAICTIEETAFTGCSSMQNMTFGTSKNTCIMAFGGPSLFKDCDTLEFDTVTIYSSKIVDNGSFQDFKNLAGVTLGGAITEIPAYMFKGCSGIGRNSADTEEIEYEDTDDDGNPITVKETVIIGAKYAFVFPKTVTTIGEGAFQGCEQINSFTNINLVKAFGESAFEGCKALSTVTINEGVTIIPANAFKGCTRLASITWQSPTKSACETIGESAFEGCISLDKITGASASFFPVSVKTIKARAFYGCRNLVETSTATVGGVKTSRILGSGVATTAAELKKDADARFNNTSGITTIESEAFKNCGTIANFVLYNGNCKIADDAFDNGVFIWSVKDSSVYNYAKKFGVYEGEPEFFVDVYNPKLDRQVVGESRDLKWTYDCATATLTFTTTATFDAAKKKDKTLVPYMDDYTENNLPQWHRYNVSKVSICKTQINIGDYAFYDNDSIKSVTLRYTSGDTTYSMACTTIGKYAFYDCDGLTSFTYSPNVKEIGEYAFADCDMLKTLSVMSGSGISIGDYAFYKDALAMKSLNVAFTITPSVVGEGAFAENPGLGTIKLTAPKNGDIEIKNKAFENCTSLQTVSITGTAAIKVYPDAFSGVETIKTVTLGSGGDLNLTSNWLSGAELTEGKNLFSDSKLTKLTLDAKTIAYDSSPFADMSSLATVTVKNLTIAPNNLFKGTGIKAITLPASLTKIQTGVFQGCENITVITIPKNVTVIGDSAFRDCGALTKVTFASGSVCETIGVSAFEGCSALGSIVNNTTANQFPVSVDEIKARAFYNTDLTTFSSGTATTPAQLKADSGARLKNTTGISIIGDEAFGSNEGLISVKLYDGNCKISDNAFDDYVYMYSVLDGKVCKQYEKRYKSYITSEEPRPYFIDIYDGKDKTKSGTITPGNISWVYDSSNGKLTLSKTDTKNTECYIKNFEETGNTAPWSTFKVISVDLSKVAALTSVGDYAFYNQIALKTIALPAKCTSIGKYAFYNTKSMSNITMAATEITIGDYAFAKGGLNNHSGVTIAPKATVGKYAFADSTAFKLTFSKGGTFANNAFDSCAYLSSITIAGSDITIGDHAFNNAVTLGTVNFTAGGTNTMHSTAFDGCKNIKSFTLDNAKATWTIKGNSGSELLEDTKMLQTIKIDCNINDSFAGVFSNKTALTTVTLDTIKLIPEGMFAGSFSEEFQSKKKTIKIPSTVREIKDGAFENNIRLVNITIPVNVTKIGNEAFKGCTALTKVTFAVSSKCNTISDYAFADCSALTAVVDGSTNNQLPVNVNKLGKYAFYNTGLISIVSKTNKTSNGLTNIGVGAFGNCQNFTNIKIYNKECKFDAITCFDDRVFVYSYTGGNVESYTKKNTKWIFVDLEAKKNNIVSGTSGDLTWTYNITNGTLTFTGTGAMANYSASNKAPWAAYRVLSVVCSAKQTNIGNYAFTDLKALGKISGIGAVTSIGDYAFKGCTSLKTFAVPAKTTSIGNCAFMDCANLATVTFSGTSTCTVIGTSAFENDTALTTVGTKNVLPKSIKELKNRAFYGCTSLTQVISGTKRGEGLTKIGDMAFSECDNLVDLRLWNGRCQLGKWVVNESTVIASIVGMDVETWCNDNNIMFVDIEGKISKIKLYGMTGDVQWTFDVYTRTLTLSVPKNKAKKKIIRMADYTSFDEAPWTQFKVKKIVFPTDKRFTKIGDYAFGDNQVLQKCLIPANITEIGKYAFYNDYNWVFTNNEIRYLASVKRTYGENCLTLAPSAAPVAAGAPTAEIVQSVEKVDDENSRYEIDGIGKVTVKMQSQNASGKAVGMDYILFIDNSPSMLQRQFCSACGNQITNGKGHASKNCRGLVKTQWAITQEVATEFAEKVYANNAENRICIVLIKASTETQEYNERETMEHDGVEYQRDRDVVRCICTDTAYLYCGLTSNIDTFRTKLNNLQVGTPGTSSTKLMSTSHEIYGDYGDWSEWSEVYDPSKDENPWTEEDHWKAWLAGLNSGGGDDESSGSGGGGGYTPSIPNLIESSIKDTDSYHCDDISSMFGGMTVHAADQKDVKYGSNFNIALMSSLKVANARQGDDRFRPANFMIVTDGEPICNAGSVANTGALMQAYFNNSFAIGVGTTETANKYLNYISSDDGSGTKFTFVVPTMDMIDVFRQILDDVFSYSIATISDVKMNSTLNTNDWHVITSVDDIWDNEDDHIADPTKYVTGADIDVNGNIITKDFTKNGKRGLAGSGSEFTYYVQLNEASRQTYGDKLVTNHADMQYRIIGGKYNNDYDKAENNDVWKLPWSIDYHRYAIKYVIKTDEVNTTKTDRKVVEKDDPTTLRYLKSIAVGYPSEYDQYGYWSTSDKRGGVTYEQGASFSMPDTAFAVNGVAPTNLPAGVTWDSRYKRPVLTLYFSGISDKVYYNPLVDNATLSGSFDGVEGKEGYVHVATGNVINTNPSSYSASRTGWSFVGWSSTRASQDVITPGTLVKTPREVTLYAVYKRGLKLQLRSDTPDYAGYDFTKEIWNLDNKFVFNDASFINATTKGDGYYLITFEKNGASELISADHLDMTGNTAKLTVKFKGWYSKLKNGKLLGTSGTDVNVNIYDNDATKYQIVGNSGNDILTSDNNTLTMYALHEAGYIVLPGCQRNASNTGNGKAPDYFLGWFTKPQPANGAAGDGGVYVGKAGEKVLISENMTLYPWFNIAPSMISSVIGDDLDGADKGFFEGQEVTYAQLMGLVDAHDSDNPVQTTPEDAAPGAIDYSGVNVWATLCHLNVEAFLHDMYPTMSAADINIYADIVNYDDVFKPVLASVKYSRNGKDSLGNKVSDSTAQVQDINGNTSAKLDTQQKNIGDIELNYTITDNGTFANNVQIITGKVSPGGKVYSLSSPVTVGYTIKTKINFNTLPKIKTKHAVMYTEDEDITADNVESFITKKQDASDKDDDRSYLPWWNKTETGKALDDSLKVVKIHNIQIDSGYELEHPEDYAIVKSITDITELFRLKDGTSTTDGLKDYSAEYQHELFKHITSFKAEVDCEDQWGKRASGRYGSSYGADGSYDNTDINPLGQSTDDRSVTVILFNNKSDYDLVAANAVVAEGLRYIDSYWLDNSGLDANTYYWGSTEGRGILQNTFRRYALMNSLNPDKYKGTVKSGSGQVVPITVNDYSGK